MPKFEEIYNETKVETTLSDTLDMYFEAETAKATFEEEATKRKFGAVNRQPSVEDKIDDIYGVTVIDDYYAWIDSSCPITPPPCSHSALPPFARHADSRLRALPA